MTVFLRIGIVLYSIFFISSIETASLQERQIRGQVKGAEGQVLPRVGILIKGTTKGTVTDLEGNFSINVPNNETVLIFTFVGYQSKEVLVGSQEVLNVKMTTDGSEKILYCCLDHGEDEAGPHGGPDREELTKKYQCQSFKNCEE